MVDWTSWTQELVNQSIRGYTNALSPMGYLFWPIFFSFIIGYIYIKNQSVVALAVGILIIFAAFSEAFLGVDVVSILMHIIVSLIITGLVLVFISRRR